MKKILLLLGAAVVLFAAVVLARTARYRPDRSAVERAPRIAASSPPTWSSW